MNSNPHNKGQPPKMKVVLIRSEHDKLEVVIGYTTNFLHDSFNAEMIDCKPVLEQIFTAIDLKTMTAKISIEKIAKYSGLSEKTVRRKLDALQEAGIISKKRERAYGSQYDHNTYKISENFVDVINTDVYAKPEERKPLKYHYGFNSKEVYFEAPVNKEQDVSEKDQEYANSWIDEFSPEQQKGKGE